jgi:hypothetical protein
MFNDLATLYTSIVSYSLSVLVFQAYLEAILIPCFLRHCNEPICNKLAETMCKDSAIRSTICGSGVV